MVFWCCGVRMMEGRMWSMMALLPFVGMVLAILAQVSTMEITKGALSQGVNKYVIIVYSNAISTLLLLPCSFIFHWLDRTPVTFSLLTNFFLLSVFGCSAQIFENGGIQYSSPMLGTAILNLVPAFTFILAVIFRLEKLEWRSSSISKTLGTIVCIAGAFLVTFYRGPALLKTTSQTLGPHLQLDSPQTRWIIGAFLLAGEALMDAFWFIVQAFILKKFRAVLIIMLYQSFFRTVLSAGFTMIAVKDTSAWKLGLDHMGLVAVLYNGIIGLTFRISMVGWCVGKIGPVYVAMFKPMGILFAVIMDAIFLGDALTLGSLIGAFIIVAGFYAVVWGKAKEEKTTEASQVGSSESSGNEAPLLRNSIEEI